MKRPKVTDFTQQRLPDRGLSQHQCALLVLLIGIVLVPLGKIFSAKSSSLYEARQVYDGTGSTVNCSISLANEGKHCEISFQLNQDIDGPLYVYYELSNYYQNHRRYWQSRSDGQLAGYLYTASEVELDCLPLVRNGTDLLNPCGLVANSFFNDVISLLPHSYYSSSSSSSNWTLDESNIALKADIDFYKMTQGFSFVIVPNADTPCDDPSVNLPLGCKTYIETNVATNTTVNYKFYYPNDDTTQYLYETYPNIISPIEGVTNEHFMVWMRTASLPTFRKLYGSIEGSSFQTGDIITFSIVANFEVASFQGAKAIVISTLNDIDIAGKNDLIGSIYMSIGIVCIISSFLWYSIVWIQKKYSI